MIKEEDLYRILSRSKELEESMSTISGDNEEFVKISKEYFGSLLSIDKMHSSRIPFRICAFVLSDFIIIINLF